MQSKSLSQISIITLLFLSTFACVDIKEDLTGQPTLDKFFHTVTDFNSFMSGAYIPLIQVYGTDAPYIASAGGEDVTTSITRWRGFATINIKDVSNPDEITSPLWDAYYSSISSCNTMLQIIDQSSLPAEELDPIKGEALFLRAFNYFHLVRWFGEVPLITEKNQANAAKELQSTVGQIYELIVGDLKNAELQLPPKQKDKSKPTQWAAKALLAKVYLSMAGYPLMETSAYSLARDKAAEVINQEQIVYSLHPHFSELWLWNNRYSSNEFIFTLYASADNGTGGYVNRSVRPEDGGEGGWGDWTSDSTFLRRFPIGDNKRYSATFYLTMRDGKSWKETRLKQPYVTKLRDGGPRSGFFEGPPLANLADGFYCVLRYADVLLIYAEAANQAEGSPSFLAYDALNKVRYRAGLPPVSDLNKDEFDRAVLEERNWELAFECNRWFDLCRRELFKLAYPNKTIDRYQYLLPKPYEQLSIMEGLKQNPGY